MITKEESSVLKAIAIISIIVCHFWGWIYKPPVEKWFINGGSYAQSGVFLFLFLSGYGIMCSYQRNGLEKFWFRRLCKIYIPFLIVVFPQLLLEIWEYRNRIEQMYISSAFLSAVGLYPNNLLDGTLWFVPFILLQYFFFYISFRIGTSSKIKSIVFVGLTFCGYYIFKREFVYVQQNDIYAFAFGLGCLYAGKLKEVMKFNKQKLYVLNLLCLLLYIITLRWFDCNIIRLLNCIFLVAFEIFSVKILLIFCFTLKPLSKIGELSYELFLTEGIFFWNKILYDIAGYNYCGLLLHLVVIGVLAILISKLTAKVNQLISIKAVKI